MNPKMLPLVLAGLFTLNACGCPLEQRSMAQAPTAAEVPCPNCEVIQAPAAPVVVRYEYPVIDGVREAGRVTARVVATPFIVAKWVLFGPPLVR